MDNPWIGLIEMVGFFSIALLFAGHQLYVLRRDRLKAGAAEQKEKATDS